jgi:hypothetical protein
MRIPCFPPRSPRTLLIASLVLAGSWISAQDPTVAPPEARSASVLAAQDGATASLENARIRVVVDLRKGTYSAFDQVRKVQILTDAAFRVDEFRSTAVGAVHAAQILPLADALGMGRSLQITSALPGGPTLILRLSLYQDQGFISLHTGLINGTRAIIQAKELAPLDQGLFFSGADLADYLTLDGFSGGPETSVERNGTTRRSLNNQLATFGKPGGKRSLVIGGLSYQEFERHTITERGPTGIKASVIARDPIGKRIDPGATYLVEQDRSYIDALTDNPFDALEAYAEHVRLAQGIVLPVCSYPIIDLWFGQVPHFGSGVRDPGDPNRYVNGKPVDPAHRTGDGAAAPTYPCKNDSTGAVEEMEIVARSGFLRYCGRVGILLEPDLYDTNNQQGWWDDIHWQRGPSNRAKNAPAWKSSNGQYVAPYETTRKWVSAVKSLGGVPMIYMQTGFRSQDYAERFPGHMIGNQANVPQLDAKGQQMYRDKERKQPRKLGYDYTDPEFVAHVRSVWEELRRAGLQGIKFDYPDFPFTGWPTAGGLEDPYATTAMHYRSIFRLAKEGLGPEAFVHERALDRGSDVTLGLSTSQRTQGDTDLIDPGMVSKVGLRWYKNRVILNYDMDGKNPYHVSPPNRDGMRSMLTMSYVVSGTLIVVPSVGRWTKDLFHDLGRIYPFHADRQSARPVDAFTSTYPSIYDYRVNPDWHQVTLYNTRSQTAPAAAENLGQAPQNPANQEMTIGVNLAGDTAFGGLGLEAKAEYYVYDFWNDRLVGRLPGSKRLEQTLRPGEARMLSVRRVEANPQFLSANRHIMQGLVDLLGMTWDEKSRELRGVNLVVGGETYRAVIACNGRRPVGVRVDDTVAKGTAGSAFPLPAGAQTARIVPVAGQPDLVEVHLDRPDNGPVAWNLTFE